MPKKDAILNDGDVVEALPNGFFTVKLDDEREVRAHLSGKMRIHYIKVLPGDRVTIEFGAADQDKGRIVRRL